MRVRELSIPGALEFTPELRNDPRGSFFEVMRQSWWERNLCRELRVAQVNCTVNNRNVVRGVHFTGLVGQAKYVCCLAGEMIDVIVDTRVGSPTFGHHEAVRLDTTAFRIVYVPEGVGHAIASRRDGTTAFYLCSAEYDAANEHGVHPFDPDLAIDWHALLDSDDEIILSERDRTAPSLREATGSMPDFDECRRLYRQH